MYDYDIVTPDSFMYTCMLQVMYNISIRNIFFVANWTTLLLRPSISSLHYIVNCMHLICYMLKAIFQDELWGKTSTIFFQSVPIVSRLTRNWISMHTSGILIQLAYIPVNKNKIFKLVFSVCHAFL